MLLVIIFLITAAGIAVCAFKVAIEAVSIFFKFFAILLGISIIAIACVLLAGLLL